MGAAGPPRITKLRFRRDVRLFLALLVGLLVTLIVVLLAVLGRASAFAAANATRHWNTAADAAMESLAAGVEDEIPPELVESRLVFIRSRYEVEAAQFKARDGRVTASGEHEGLAAVQRRLRGGTLTLYFDDSGVRNTRRSYLLVTPRRLRARSFSFSICRASPGRSN